MILKNCRLIPELCEGFAEEMADIRIEGNLIAEILPAGGHYVGEEVIDCKGKTVMPGLTDLHAHLWFTGPHYLMEPLCLQSEYSHIADSVRFMYHLLAYGFTSIRDLGCAYNVGAKLRDSINAGKLIGPNIQTSGHILTPHFIGFDLPFSDRYGRSVNGPYEARAEVRRTLYDGADFIKIYGGNPGDADRRGGRPLFYEDETREIVETAKREGTYVAIHSTAPMVNETSIEAGIYTIEHALYWTQENTDQVVKKGYQTALVPTTYAATSWRTEAFNVEDDPCVGGLVTAYEEGNILIGYGTDLREEQFTALPAAEFLNRENMMGFKRIDILKQATSIACTINGTSAVRGTVKVGKIADLIVVDGNPDEDLSVFNHPCSYVLKDGVVVAQNGLVKTF